MNRIVVIFLVLLCSACTEISYKEPQPKGIKTLNTIPSNLRGSYFLLSESDSNFQDTIVIMANGYRIGFRDPNEKPESRFLSDSLVIKQFKGYYFVSMREEFEWYLRIIKPLPDDNLQFYGMGNIDSYSDEEKEKFLDRLSKEVPLVKNEIDGSLHYVIDPSPKKLITLIDKGYFKKSLLQKVQ